jgi:uncharacterized protein YciI
MNRLRKRWFLGALLMLSLSVGPLVGGPQPAKPQVYVALYERGAAWVEGKSVRDLPNFEEHVQHIRSLEPHKAGAGPFASRANESFVGMVVLLAQSEEEARKLAESDPFVMAKYTKVKIWRWQVDSLKGCF